MNLPFILASYNDDPRILMLVGILAALFPLYGMVAARCRN